MSAEPTTDVLAATPGVSAASIRLTWLLALLATLTLEIAAGDGERSAAVIIALIVSQAAAVLLAHFFARRWDVRTKALLVVIFGLATMPFAAELLARGLTRTMLPLELLLLAHFRNVVLAVAVFAHRRECQQMCGSLSLFLTIFASALSTQLWLQSLVVAFAVIGIWWLMGSYWERLQGTLVVSSQNQLSGGWWFAWSVCFAALLIAVPVAGTQTRALQGFMPSSGGNEAYSESARSGVGDGDHLVAGTENIQSFAPIDEAPFLTSHEPSLYDVFDDTYNEPVQPRRPDRAIALPPQQRRPQAEHELATSQQAGRRFSTLRKAGAPRSNIGNRPSNALFYVKGRVPLHLKLEVFDRYDGIDWFPEELPEHNPPLVMETLHGRPWVRMPVAKSLDIFGLPETHALKIIRLDTNRIPSPTQLLGVHLDQVDRADFFLWAQPGIVRLDRDQLPSLTTFHVHSRVVDERLLQSAPVSFSGGSPLYRNTGDDEQSQRIRELAERWTAGATPGWPRIQAVIQRLRAEYIHDRDARPPAGSNHTAADFLLASRRGPDYQFASAAVQLLRSLGYSVRLASGFYVAPSRYEARSRHTPVLAEDVHFWAEVHAGAGGWIPLEPTPGYELLTPPPTFLERIQSAARACWEFICTHAVKLSFTAATLAFLFWQRRWLAELAALWHWSWWPVRDERQRIQRTLRLLAGRLRRTGRVRPSGMTLTRWLRQLDAWADEAERRGLNRFLQLADWASFAPLATEPPSRDVRSACEFVVQAWSLGRLCRRGDGAIPAAAFTASPRRGVWLASIRYARGETGK